MQMRLGSVVLALTVTVASAAALTPRPSVALRIATGALSEQTFTQHTAALAKGTDKDGQACWDATFAGAPGIHFRAWCDAMPDHQVWRYEISNRSPDLIVCDVTFPSTEPVRLGTDWEHDEIIWPSLYQGARLTGLTSADVFQAKAREAAKNIPYLTGQYQGDLCLPFCVQQTPGTCVALLVEDPTHEVFRLTGVWAPEGMVYSVQTHPGVHPGASWSFGDVVMVTLLGADWHDVADRYREWLVATGFGRPEQRHGESATLVYGRWDRLDPEEAILWAGRLGIRDLLLWVNLYGRGDQYYPCYFPSEKAGGMAGMQKALGLLRRAGVNPYFYTNGYLLSPLQTPRDVEAWHTRDPEAYPRYIADQDQGYAAVVTRFRQHHEFAGEWLQTPGGILPLRVRRPDFTYGEHPVYTWHGRPFYAACIATPEWRKLFRDTARLHVEMGAAGLYIDQPGAIHPELCAAAGHDHDGETFGFWNRAYLNLMQETREAARQSCPDFFLEIEGSADLYAHECARGLGAFGASLPPLAFPALLKYTIPWLMTDQGTVGLTVQDAEIVADLVARTFLLGGSFRVALPHTFEPGQTSASVLDSLAAALATRRRLSTIMDTGVFHDTRGLDVTGGEGTWFSSDGRALVVLRIQAEGGSALLPPACRIDGTDAVDLVWHSGAEQRIALNRDGAERLTTGSLAAGLHLLLLRLH